jgi:hypothetical protein
VHISATTGGVVTTGGKLGASLVVVLLAVPGIVELHPNAKKEKTTQINFDVVFIFLLKFKLEVIAKSYR